MALDDLTAGAMFYKEILSGVAVALTLAAFIPYIRNIVKGLARPHVFSWILGRSNLCCFSCADQGKRRGGRWPVGVSGVITLFIAFLAYIKRADITVTNTDRLFFVLASSALPFWRFTSDPFWAVAILTAVDVLGFGPTVRNAYHFPHAESVPFFVLLAVRNVLVILALENYSATTVLFPAVIAGACMALTTLVISRRRAPAR